MNRITAEWTTSLDRNGVGEINDASWAVNESMTTYTVDVPFFAAGQTIWSPFGSNLDKFVSQCLGYSKRTSPGVINRWPPARHPFRPWLRATRITKCEGIKETLRIPAPLSELLGGNLTVQIFKVYRLTILFESLTYDAYADNEVTRERDRYVTRLPAKPSARFIYREGGTFTFCIGDGAPSAAKFPQGVSGIIPEYDFVWTWEQAPHDAIFVGRIPAQIHACLGKVNEAEETFTDDVDAGPSMNGGVIGLSGQSWIGVKPQSGGQPTNTALPINKRGYAAGTLLLVGAEIELQQSPVVPQVMGINPLEQPRTYRVHYMIKEQLKGHNRFPFPATPKNWYLATHNGNMPAVGGQPLYESIDFNLLFTPL